MLNKMGVAHSKILLTIKSRCVISTLLGLLICGSEISIADTQLNSG